MFTEVLFVYMYLVKNSFSFKNLGQSNVSRKMNTFFWHPKKSAKLSRGIHEGTVPNLTQVNYCRLILLLSSLTLYDMRSHGCWTKFPCDDSAFFLIGRYIKKECIFDILVSCICFQGTETWRPYQDLQECH